MRENQFLRTITVLPVNDINESLQWFKTALGMEAVYRHEGAHEGEATNYAVMARDGVQVHLILDEPPPYASPWTKAGVGYLYLKVRDVDAMYEATVSKGVAITRALQTENWGARGFNLTDPSGNAIHIEQ